MCQFMEHSGWTENARVQTKPELIRAIRERELRSVSAVFDYLAGGKEDAASKPGLASLLKSTGLRDGALSWR